jgi:sodium-dependent dicarboxylate transporter 2/3/5
MILPISTPPNALAYATNLIQQKDMAKMGIIIGLTSIILGYLTLFAAGSLNIV